MTYIDGFVIAVAEREQAAIRQHAHHVDWLFIEHGATRVVEAGATTCPTAKSPTSTARSPPRTTRRWPFRGSNGRTRPPATM